MKNILVSIAAILTLNSAAQVEHVDSTNHFTVTGYAGILAGAQVPTDTLQAPIGFSYLRVGATALWQPSQHWTFYSLGGAELSHTGSVTPFSLFAIGYIPTKRVSIISGKIASPMTEIRPMPVTRAGQFEPWTRAQIPGNSLGLKTRVTIGKNATLVAGSAWRNRCITTELAFKTKGIHAGAYYVPQTRMFGGAVTVEWKNGSGTLVYNHKGTAGGIVFHTIPKACSFYVDAGVSTNTWKLVRAEAGVLKMWNGKVLKALIGFGYAHEIRSVKTYCFVSI